MSLSQFARQFNAGAEFIRFPYTSADGDTGDEPITLAALVRMTALDGSEPSVPVALAPDLTGTATGRRIRIANPGLTFSFAEATPGTASTAVLVNNQWALVGVTRDTGGNCRVHLYRFDTSTWTHQATGVLTRSAAATAGAWVVGNIRVTAPIDSSYIGQILAVATWQQVLTDAQFVGLVETDRCKLSTWLTVGPPVHVWGFTQTSTATAVVDLKGTANQASVTGTTVFDAGSAILPWDPALTGASSTIVPDADIVTTGWTTTPLWSKLNDASDATVITGTAA